MKLVLLIAATMAAGGMMLVAAALSLVLELDLGPVGALVGAGSALVALSALGIVARRALAR